MSELNFKPAAGSGFAGDKAESVPALDASTPGTSSQRGKSPASQRRRLNVLRYTIDPGFRLFRVF